MAAPAEPPALDWTSAYALVGLDAPPATPDEIEEAAALAAPSRPGVTIERDEAAALTFAEVDTLSLSARELQIYEAGFFAGYLSRQPEIDAAENAYKQADHEADRLYRIAFDHDYHDCTIHENRGKYRGAATRVLDDAWGDNWDAENPYNR